MNSASGALSGMAAGLTGTAAMTAVMVGGHRLLPRSQQTPLPPVKITEALARRWNLHRRTHVEGRRRAAWVAHFFYGMAGGVAYSAMIRRWDVPVALKGAAYSLGVWAAGYLGWLPALNLPASAAKEGAARNALMIASHLVWGTVLASVMESEWPLRSESRRGNG